MGNGVFAGEAGAHCCYIIVEFSSRQLVVLVGTGRGVPRESMRQLVGITDMQRGANCFCRPPLKNLNIYHWLG